MQNIEAILTELGIEVPADKKENLTKRWQRITSRKLNTKRSWERLRPTGTPGRRRPRRRKPL